jgi:hypothetical protein
VGKGRPERLDSGAAHDPPCPRPRRGSRAGGETMRFPENRENGGFPEYAVNAGGPISAK